MTKVTNTAVGPRGVITADGGTVFLEPGESQDLDLHPDHDLYEGVKKGGAAKAKESDSDELKPLAKMNKTELLAAAKDENVELADDATNAQIVEAIEKARAAKE
jgi:hypothetical protein